MSVRLSCDDVTRDLSEGRDHPALGTPGRLPGLGARRETRRPHAGLGRHPPGRARRRRLEPCLGHGLRPPRRRLFNPDRADDARPRGAAASVRREAWSSRGRRRARGPRLPGHVPPRRRRPARGRAVQVAQAETPQNEFEFDPGEIGLIRDDGHGLRVITLAQDDRPFVLDRGFDMYNEIEALAE